MPKQPLIAPSLLAADFTELGREVADVMAAGADVLHFDVMDSHYVPNLSFGPLVLEALRRRGVDAPVHVHLMARPVDRLIDDFLAAGADAIAIHPDASERPGHSLERIVQGGARAGLVLSPGTPASVLEPFIDAIDKVLVMSVQPGFGGQSFLPSSLDTVRAVRELIDAAGSVIALEIDGGIKVDNIGRASAAGADMFVAGSAIFGVAATAASRVEDYRRVIATMRERAAQAAA